MKGLIVLVILALLMIGFGFAEDETTDPATKPEVVETTENITENNGICNEETTTEADDEQTHTQKKCGKCAKKNRENTNGTEQNEKGRKYHIRPMAREIKLSTASVAMQPPGNSTRKRTLIPLSSVPNRGFIEDKASMPNDASVIPDEQKDRIIEEKTE